jgi:hypothetical protein
METMSSARGGTITDPTTSEDVSSRRSADPATQLDESPLRIEGIPAHDGLTGFRRVATGLVTTDAKCVVGTILVVHPRDPDPSPLAPDIARSGALA